MKLIIAVVHSDDSHRLVEKLNYDGFSVTKLATTGGFLRSGNTTLMIGVDEDKVDTVLGIVKDKCQTRKQITATTAPVGGVMPFPIEVTVGGATVFITNIERFEKL